MFHEFDFFPFQFRGLNGTELSQRVARRSNGASAPFDDGGSLVAQLCHLVDENLSALAFIWK
jgi:hypothetical protein